MDFNDRMFILSSFATASSIACGVGWDVEEGRIAEFDYQAAKLIELQAKFTDDRFAFKIANFEREFNVRDMPYVYGAGKVRLCTSQCRVLLREVELIPL